MLSILVPALAGSAPLPAAGIAVGVAVATGVGVLSYWLLERPLLGRMRGLLLARWRRPRAAVGGGT